jgi:hypothetical protein
LDILYQKIILDFLEHYMDMTFGSLGIAVVKGKCGGLLAFGA